MNKTCKSIVIGVLNLSCFYGCTCDMKLNAEEKCKKPKNLITNEGIKSEPDPGTELNEELAGKARKLVRYFLDKKRDPAYESDKYWSWNTPLIEIENNFIKKRYVMRINDIDESCDKNIGDFIEINVMTDKETEEIKLTDHGFDGRCDLGYKVYVCVQDKKFNLRTKEGMEHQDAYQKEYESAMNDLIKYFENK